MKGWKNLNRNLTCKGFKFEIGKTYKHIGGIEMCSHGFHFHANPFDLFQYYDFNFDKTIVAEIEASGQIITDNHKSVCSEIAILRILSKEEVELLGNIKNNIGWGNTGDRNTGDRNTGDRNTGDSNTGGRNTGYSNTGDSNTGYRNTGDRNTGDSNTGYRNTGDSNTGYRNTGDRNTGGRNTGDSNTGDWNRCNYASGFFNTKIDNIMVFNQPCALSVWQKANKPKFLYFDKNWHDCIKHIAKNDIAILQKLPNFDPTIFKEISGFSIEDLTYYEILFRKF